METDDFIRSLASGVKPVARRAAETRIAIGAGAGAAAGLLALALWLGFRPDLQAALGTFPFWMKAIYTASIALFGFVAAAHLARPDARPRRWFWIAAAPIGLLMVLAAFELARTPLADWGAVWLGHSARACPLRILTLSIPIFIGLVWAFRQLAPTRPQTTGAFAGLAAGGMAATLYGLHCPEVAATFVLSWYSLGILGAAFAGSVAGRFLFRW
jgi:hypothetical protein